MKRLETPSGIEVKHVYDPEDLTDFDPSRSLGRVGEYPYTRGIYSDMYRGRLWTMRQYAGYGTAEETNRRFKYLLDQGQTGLSVAFDLPTQLGYDSDHPLALGEVGRVGVAVSSLEDMETLFEGIPLDQVSTSMTINATSLILLAMYVVLARRAGLSLESLSGTVQNDILKEYVARGNYIFPISPSLKLTTDVFSFCKDNLPKWNTISISGYHIREAGATAVQELAFTLANATAYVEAALSVGLEVDSFAPRLSFFFSSHHNLFEETAKFRAARRIWANLMRDRFKAQNPNSMKLRFHTQTAGSTLTAQQPENNIARVALQALSAVLGGTQSLHTNSYDEALSLPSPRSVMIALRTQQILAFESGVPDSADPLGGSYLVESLTNQVEEGVNRYFERIEQMGGAVRCVETGFFQREIEESAYRAQREVESGEKVWVGVNSYRIEEEEAIGVLKVDPRIRKGRVEGLTRLRQERDGARVNQALLNVRIRAKNGDNLMPPVIEAVQAHATLGEISDALREVYGEYGQ